MRKKGIIKTLLKCEISGTKFLRATNVNELNENINISLYIEIIGDNNEISYKKVYPNELPVNTVSKLSSMNNYESVTKEEADNFFKIIKEINKKVKDVNEFNDFEYLTIDGCSDITYILCKEEKQDFYNLGSLFLDEKGKVIEQSIIQSMELPYVLMDILDKNDFKSITILLFENHFVRVVKEDDKYIILIYQYVPDEYNPLINLIDAYTIVQGKEEFYLIRDSKSDLAIKLDENNMQKYTFDFLRTIELE